MKVLFIDRSDHKKTHSADFFINILRTQFEVSTFYYDTPYNYTIPQSILEGVDVFIFWEFLFNRHKLGLAGRHCVFVPMYDNEWGSVWQWKRIAKSGMSVISFSEAISSLARRCEVKHLLDVRFAFNPDDYPGMEGDPRKVTLWDRGQISFDHIKSLFSPDAIDKLTIFRRPEAGIIHSPISETDKHLYHIDLRETDFIPTNEYLALQKESGVYISPRWKEGIGMTFLEQLAMGKCVIAHNDCTMNEYITNGVNGLLRNFKKPQQHIKASEIESVRKTVKQTAKTAYTRWVLSREKICPFIKEACNQSTLALPPISDKLFYAAFLLEGVSYRLKQRFS